MGREPLVSVVIPTYSRPEYLGRCIDSVLAQTYPQIELFVVDDNDPDTDARRETEKLMERYAGQEKVHYLKHEKNKNGSAARNTGWRASHGDYLTFLDDDDIIEPQKIERQVACLESLDESWGMCYTAYRLIKEHGADQISSEKRSGYRYVDGLMRTFFMGSGSNLFLRRCVVEEIGGYDESFRRNQDVEFMARALEHYKIAYIDEVLLTICQEGARIQGDFEKFDGYARHYLNKFRDRIERLPPEERERVISVISLERCRVAFGERAFLQGCRILAENRVRFRYLVKYFLYLADRAITHRSYGFQG